MSLNELVFHEAASKMQTKLGMYAFRANIRGFSDTNTGSQDYGQGVIRIDSRLVDELKRNGQDVSRNDLVRLENSSGNRTFAVLRARKLETPNTVALELDDRLKLGVNKGSEEELFIRKAYKIEAIEYFWKHINLVVRIEFRLAVFLTMISFVLGATVSLLLSL